jgi:flagellar basal-body rod protein FlgB
MFDVSQVPLFALADRRFAWIDQRQEVLAQNLANADTPGWRARDLKPFQALLATPPVALAATDPAHLAGTVDAAVDEATAATAERAPDGNGVALDHEMMKVADTDMAHAVTTGLVTAWLGMFRTAIGR